MRLIQTSWPVVILRCLPALLCMAVIFELSSRSKLPKVSSISDEAISLGGHFGAYAILAICFWWALGMADLASGNRVLVTLAGAVLYGLSDEWHQSFVPGRTPDIRDIFVDSVGAMAGLFLVTLLARRLEADNQERENYR